MKITLIICATILILKAMDIIFKTPKKAARLKDHISRKLRFCAKYINNAGIRRDHRRYFLFLIKISALSF